MSMRRRVEENRKQESLDVLKDIEGSVEATKAIINQFKSLSRAQQNRFAAMPLDAALHRSCAVAKANGIDCNVTCRHGLTVIADPQHFAECLDELVANSMKWLTKEPRKISITARDARPDEVPDALESDRPYAVIHYEDNGPGIAAEHKDKIFDLFYTTHPEGTGLGLALVRRIIEGHSGIINEVGVPGKGVHFVMLVPATVENGVVAINGS